MERNMYLVYAREDIPQGEPRTRRITDQYAETVLLPIVWLPSGTTYQSSSDLVEAFGGGPLQKWDIDSSNEHMREYRRITLGSSFIPVAIRSARIRGMDVLLLRNPNYTKAVPTDHPPLGLKVEQLQEHLSLLKAEGKKADSIPILVKDAGVYRRARIVIVDQPTPMQKDTMDTIKKD